MLAREIEERAEDVREGQIAGRDERRRRQDATTNQDADEEGNGLCA
jgi:hypothetical protein